MTKKGSSYQNYLTNGNDVNLLIVVGKIGINGINWLNFTKDLDRKFRAHTL